jgi:hypothetical protein
VNESRSFFNILIGYHRVKRRDNFLLERSRHSPVADNAGFSIVKSGEEGKRQLGRGPAGSEALSQMGFRTFPFGISRKIERPIDPFIKGLCPL